MNKKTIIFILIALLILNTLFWINLIVQGIPRVYRAFLTGEIVERSYMERLSITIREWGKSKVAITLLLITNSVLIAISFMIILLYKKDRNFKR